MNVETGNGHGVTLFVTDAGLAALGIESEDAPGTDTPAEFATSGAPTATARIPREGTKQAALIELLRTPDGATIEQMATQTGWQAHTVRGAMAGTLKKKLGLTITSEKVHERGRVYRLG